MRVDLHIHSKYSSDGVLNVEDIVKIAVRRGLHGISITDHNTLKAYKKVEKGKLLILPGMEVSTSEGHVLVYGIQEEIPRDMSLDETLEIAKELGGFTVAAHPYRFWSGIGEKNVLRFSEKFNAIEVKNSRCKGSSNKKAFILADRLRLGKTAGSDAHFSDEIGLCFLEVEFSDTDELMKEIEKGNARICGTDRNLRRTGQYVYKTVSEWIKRGFRKI